MEYKGPDWQNTEACCYPAGSGHEVEENRG